MGQVFIFWLCEVPPFMVDTRDTCSVIKPSSVVCQRLSLFIPHSRNTLKTLNFDQRYRMPPTKCHKTCSKKEQFLSAGKSAHSIVIVYHPRYSTSSDCLNTVLYGWAIAKPGRNQVSMVPGKPFFPRCICF